MILQSFAGFDCNEELVLLGWQRSQAWGEHSYLHLIPVLFFVQDKDEFGTCGKETMLFVLPELSLSSYPKFLTAGCGDLLGSSL